MISEEAKYIISETSLYLSEKERLHLGDALVAKITNANTFGTELANEILNRSLGFASCEELAAAPADINRAIARFETEIGEIKISFDRVAAQFAELDTALNSPRVQLSDVESIVKSIHKSSKSISQKLRLHALDPAVKLANDSLTHILSEMETKGILSLKPKVADLIGVMKMAETGLDRMVSLYSSEISRLKTALSNIHEKMSTILAFTC
jgi:glucose-6-phosphate-specific signal transduction histidine kinase